MGTSNTKERCAQARRQSETQARGRSQPRTPWWVGIPVLARRDPDGPYAKENCLWRAARNEHEAMIGIEEWDPEEPVRLPMSRRRFEYRSRLRTDNERRMFDVWLRMMYRCGHERLPPWKRAVSVTSTAFPRDWHGEDTLQQEVQA